MRAILERVWHTCTSSEPQATSKKEHPPGGIPMKIARSVIAAASLAAATAMSFGPAVAADMPVKAAVTKVPIVAPLFDWTGWYGGLNYGTGASQTDGTTPNNGNTSFDRGGK